MHVAKRESTNITIIIIIQKRNWMGDITQWVYHAYYYYYYVLLVYCAFTSLILKQIHVLCYERNVYSNPLINLIYTDHTCIVTIAQHMQLLKCVHTKIACSQITTGHSQHNWTLSINMETTSLLVSECSNGWCILCY